MSRWTKVCSPCFNTNRKHSNKLPISTRGYDNLKDSSSHAHNNARLPDNDILLSRWKTPASPAYFEPSVRPLSPRVFDSKVDIWSAFFFYSKPPKEVGVNRNLLSLWDISFQSKWRWMTGTPASPVEPRYWPQDPKVSGSRLERADQVLRGGDSQMQICSRV